MTSPHKPSIQRQLLDAIIRWLLPLALTVLLVGYMFSKVNFADMMEIISHGVRYQWILAAMGLSIVSHIIRAARWRLQLSQLSIRPPMIALSCSIFGCYALNLLFPRLGEVWRCTYIAKRQNAPFTTVLGTMVADRLADTLAVGLLTLMTFILANSALNAFLAKYPIGRDIIRIFSDPWVWLSLIAGTLTVWFIIRHWRNSGIVLKLRKWVSQLWQGFAAVAHMKHRSLFLLFTLLLWGCYYFQLYLAFFAFDFTRHLCSEAGLAFGLLPCLVAFVLSSIGMAIPSNGGLGPWNIAVMFGLALYGISDPQGTAFSMVQWSGQTVMLITLGIFTMIYISLTNSQKNKK